MPMHPRSIPKLDDVHPDLVRVVLRCAEFYQGDYFVIEGKRLLAKQRELLKRGASTTLRSRHIPEMNQSGLACAVDLGVWLDLDGDGEIDNGEVRWDWPLYRGLADAMKEAAQVEGVQVEWGGDWKSFKDGPHFQLPWGKYP